MIISMTPIRVSFLGGGTDYPEYFDRHGGATLGSTIDKYTYITVSPLTEFFDHSTRVSYSTTELCINIDEIQHPSVRECLRFLGIECGVEINVVADLPARTGLGSSSSFTVGLLHALHGFKGKLVGWEQLAEEAVYVEREMIKERVGLQDQYTCARGGLLHLEFNGNNSVNTEPVVISKDRWKAFSERLMLFYTGIQRYAHEVLEQQLERTTAGVVSTDLRKLHGLVEQGIDVLSNGHDLSSFGELLNDGWNCKKRLSDTVSNQAIDDAYERALKSGAIGGKLLGAGGGGFLLLYVEPYNHDAVRQSLSDMREVPFEFENQGSQIVFYRP